jgi:thiosulfate reductase cytochrome b subunit
MTARPAHPWPVRVMHWIGAYAMICMILSGWQIYNASPSLPFTIPNWMTLGGWLAGGIAWHISAMWLLVADGAAYLIYGVVTGHFRRSFGVPRPGEIIRDTGLALRFKLPHQAGVYNSVQRLLYILVIAAAVLAVTTGLSIWKPVQFGLITNLFGGYPTARLIHLGVMAAIVAFVVVHLVLVALFPRTLVSMVVSRPAKEGHS